MKAVTVTTFAMCLVLLSCGKATDPTSSGPLPSPASVAEKKPSPSAQTLVGHTAIVSSVAFSPDGLTLASGGNDGDIRLWDVQTAKQRGILQIGAQINALAFSPDGRKIIAGLQILDKSGALAVVSGKVVVWNIDTGAEQASIEANRAPVLSLALSSDGALLTTGNADHSVLLLGFPSGKSKYAFADHSSMVRAVAFSGDDRRRASGSRGEIAVWDVATGKLERALEGYQSDVNAISFSPDGKTLAAACGDGRIRLWDIETGKSTRELFRDAPTVGALAFLNDGKRLFEGSGDGTVGLWDLAACRTFGPAMGKRCE